MCFSECEGCLGFDYIDRQRCSECGDLVPEKALAMPKNMKWLCPKCAAEAINKLEAASGSRAGEPPAVRQGRRDACGTAN